MYWPVVHAVLGEAVIDAVLAPAALDGGVLPEGVHVPGVPAVAPVAGVPVVVIVGGQLVITHSKSEVRRVLISPPRNSPGSFTRSFPLKVLDSGLG